MTRPQMWTRIVHEVKDLFRFRWVIFSVVSSTLRMRYRRSVLGFGWSMVGPMMNYMIVGLVITRAGKFQTPNFVTFMLVGSAIYNFMAVGFNLGAQSIVSNENYIKKIYLPKSIYPLNNVSMEFINLMLQFVAIFGVLALLAKIPWSWTLLEVPPFLMVIYFFTLGLGITLGVISVFFRDFLHIIPILMQACFFLTPIVYPAEHAPDFIARFLPMNPFYIMVELIRQPVYGAVSPSAPVIYSALGLAAVSLMGGFCILKSLDNRILFKL